jgi:hypothetical protein
MKKILFTILITLNIFFLYGQSYKLNIPIKIEVYDTYTAKDLAQITVDIDKKFANFEDSLQKNNWQLNHPLFCIFQLNLDNKNFPRLSPYLGYSESSDTSKVLDYLSNSMLMPKGVKYEWIPCSEKIFSLVVHRENETKAKFDNIDIKTIEFEKNNKPNEDDYNINCYHDDNSEYLIKIKLQKQSISKILKSKGDLLNVRVRILSRVFNLALPFDKVEDEILIKDNISSAYIDVLKTIENK